MEEPKKYVVTTTCTAVTVYYINANSKEEAEEKYRNSDWVDEEITDYMDETIFSVEEDHVN